MYVTSMGKGIVYYYSKRYILPIYLTKDGTYITKLKTRYIPVVPAPKKLISDRDHKFIKLGYKVFVKQSFLEKEDL